MKFFFNEKGDNEQIDWNVFIAKWYLEHTHQSLGRSHFWPVLWASPSSRLPWLSSHLSCHYLLDGSLLINSGLSENLYPACIILMSPEPGAWFPGAQVFLFFFLLTEYWWYMLLNQVQPMMRFRTHYPKIWHLGILNISSWNLKNSRCSMDFLTFLWNRS